jgi:ferredoxin
MNYTAKIDKSLCLGSGLCVGDSPQAFRFDENDLAEPTQGVHTVPHDHLLTVAHACPGAAISLYAEDGAPVYEP